ncbi:hypothetical protein ACPPVW_18665 [Leifsonia sp. McL0607]|uniref:hypothetical protein n=1 Tax=Leifsonia sp. McL0607 TaxID=3415672 RepID=UPI003CF2E435
MSRTTGTLSFQPAQDDRPLLESVVTAEIPRAYAGRLIRTRKLQERALELRALAAGGFRLIETEAVSEADGSDRYRIIDTLKFDADYHPFGRPELVGS